MSQPDGILLIGTRLLLQHSQEHRFVNVGEEARGGQHVRDFCFMKKGSVVGILILNEVSI
jgi:hypothetical protein